MTKEDSDPAGWTATTLGQLLPISYGKALPEKSRDPDGRVPVFGSSGVTGYHSAPITHGPSIIVGRKGSAGQVRFAFEPCWPIDTTYFAEGTPSTNLRFLFFLLGYLRLSSLDKSTAVPSLSRDDYNAVSTLIPPAEEQHRIVAKIEELFSDLDAGVAALERVRIALKRYRASVLVAAAEGRLTRSWRTKDALLERGDWPHSSRYPVSWESVALTSLVMPSQEGIKTGPFGSLLKKEEHCPAGVPVLGIENIRPLRFRFGSRIHISERKALQLSAYDVLGGDLLISRSGTVGVVCVAPTGLGEARLSTNLMRLRLRSGRCLPQYLAIALTASPWVCSQIRERTSGSTRDFLNRRILKSLVVPVPPLGEQEEIVALVDEQLENCSRLETATDGSAARKKRLRQAILGSAFEGRLVPQDPTDAPASILLDRIKAEREQVQQTTKPGGQARQRRGSRKGYTLVPLPLDEME